jgi:hypothetical protein
VIWCQYDGIGLANNMPTCESDTCKFGIYPPSQNNWAREDAD